MALIVALSLALAIPAAAFAAELASAVSDTATNEFTPHEVDYRTNATIDVAEDASACLLNDADYGISAYKRANKGTNRAYTQEYWGYRYPLSNKRAFSAVVTDDAVLVYIPKATVEGLGIDIDDYAFQRTFIAELAAIDDAAAEGGPQFTKSDLLFAFTSEQVVSYNGYVYNFCLEIEDDHWYTCVVLPGSEDASAGGVYAMSGELTAAEDTAIAGKATGLAALGEFFQTLDWRPLWVSLKTSLVGLVIVFILGLLAAWGTIKINDRLKGIFDTIFTIPMVLPPTVCGFLLMLFFGNKTAVGNWLIDHGIDLVFTWPAAVISCVVVAFPLMYRSSRGAFEQLDSTMLDAARTLGWGEGKIFLKLMLPLAWPSIASGTVLAFARAIGEFGATLFFAGNYAGITQTIPIAIYYDWMGGKSDVAIFWVIVIILISFLVILFINVYSSHTQRYKKGGNVESDS